MTVETTCLSYTTKLSQTLQSHQRPMQEVLCWRLFRLGGSKRQENQEQRQPIFRTPQQLSQLLWSFLLVHLTSSRLRFLHSVASTHERSRKRSDGESATSLCIQILPIFALSKVAGPHSISDTECPNLQLICVRIGIQSGNVIRYRHELQGTTDLFPNFNYHQFEARR